MHVALYSNSRLPVRGYGGTQRVVVWLARGLVELGHRVTLLAPTGSRLREAEVIELDPDAVRKPALDLTHFVPDSIDLLHAHARLARVLSCPTVFTLHGNRAEATATPNTIFLSANHARRHGGTAFVYNGVDPSEYTYRPIKGGYDLFLGRLHRVKGYRWAVQGAKRAGKRLIVAGGWRLSLRRSLRFAGAVDGSRKADLLADAECLWMPALWDEPFGLTLVEAMMSGTPVLGTRRGALPEIVTPDVGLLGNTLEELVELRPLVARCEPEACRGRAERWFTHLAMAEEYDRMYRHYLSERELPAGRLIT
ncbi:MAG TPA: glycosyltransferase [Gemmatimonadales bacterium]|nr:glycosyltransferase [Gemmatimonadales bacterium]